ncbi:uncharacterized protein LOC125315981 [Rhodamnia argentea]|uniref:Uncharacterized protein LOC125315981 n=1 Tax=Rhodamnia argentea TaxID=178133 RepID=A0ABM3HPN6_9MYRT|nr:uncharacterized protein LOC125315981 [Rhodamnia argentea]
MSNRGRGTRRASSSRAQVVEDPRVDGVLRALEQIGNMMGGQAEERAATVAQQAQERAANVAQVAEAAILAVNMVNGNNGNNGNNGRGNGGGNAHGTVPNWTVFAEAFNAKYFSEAAQEQKLVEFQNLRQNRMTIDRYEAEFSRLSKYTPRMVENPVDRARRFRDGLRSDLRSQLVLLNLKDYDEQYERGRLVERDMRERGITFGPRFAPARDNRHFGKRHVTNNRRFVPSVKKNIGKPTYQANWTYRLCGRKHGNGPCPSKMGANLNRPPNQGKVYAVARKEAENAPGVVTGKISLCDQAAYALFDPGASHSFVSAQFADLAEMELKPLDVILHVTTPLKDKVLVSLGCQNCKIVIGGSEEPIDLAVLAMYDFDVIIGMDWLETKLDGIAVVHEFPDVFPQELPGLPSEREVEFVIELAHGTEPISKAPYRMSLLELKELKAAESSYHQE